MHNCFFQGFGHEKTIIKSEDFFLNGSMLTGGSDKGILEIGGINCIITFKILI